jgi:hypothetical protein
MCEARRGSHRLGTLLPTHARLIVPISTIVSLYYIATRGGSADHSQVPHPPEEREKHVKDPAAYLRYRHMVESYMNSFQLAHWPGSDLNVSFSKATEESMNRMLAKKPQILEHLKPKYPVACKRVSPGPRYLECLVEDKLNFIPKGVKEVTETGIVDDDGILREVDTIICATGFDT